MDGSLLTLVSVIAVITAVGIFVWIYGSISESHAEGQKPADENLPESVNPAATGEEVDTDADDSESDEQAEDESGYIDIYKVYPVIDDLSDERKELLGNMIVALPELPRVSLDLLPILSQPGAGMKEVSEIIERDQSTAARLLRWVNSGFYGLEQKVDSLHRAVTLLGLDAVRSAVIYDSFNRVMEPEGLDGVDSYTIWTHCAAVSTTAKHLGRIARNVEPDVAATAGLFHDIGLLLFLVTERRGFEAAIEASRENGTALIDYEDEFIGFNHMVFGELFIRSWRLPEVIAEAVGNHHNPMSESSSNLAGVIWLADYVVSRMGFECPSGEVLKLKDEDEEEILKKLGIPGKLGTYITEGLLKQIKKSSVMFPTTSAKSISKSVTKAVLNK